MSKAFTKDDVPEAPVVVRHRPSLPDGVPNYVTARGLVALRAGLAAVGPDNPRRAELEQRVASAVVVPPPAEQEEVRFGANVTLRGADGRTRQVRIVGVDEADPVVGLIAFVAPLARALLGRRAGDVVDVKAPGGGEELEILAVDYEDGG
ncbi:MAG TPA: GreA/GreB family elongation factor [Polyangia bacterium]|nr:GreA/GreB family elongation factor [Polyangia bacterium]